MEPMILSVSQLNSAVKALVDSTPGLQTVCVRGELSNYKLYPSGHHYFTLKDAEASLRCVMFKGNSFSLRFRPQNGMSVVAVGRISVFPRDGVYQLYCTHMLPDGAGDLNLAFDQLKQKLYREGLFDQAHKRPLPDYPHRIGIVTSPVGAALQDMLRIIGARYPLSKVLIIPSRVQGEEAAAEIAAAIDYASDHHVADVLIVGRGGGSAEDLWPFNEEIVARAIYRCTIPVVSAVGHEPDVSISDFVADLRAATPSNAAELVTPDKQELLQQLRSLQRSMNTAFLKLLDERKLRLSHLADSPLLQHPDRLLQHSRMRLDLTGERFASVMKKYVNTRRDRYLHLSAKLDALSPLKVLQRGYAAAFTPDGTVIRSVRAVKPGDKIKLSFYDGSAVAGVESTKEEYDESSIHEL